jgi:hypothetical protein
MLRKILSPIGLALACTPFEPASDELPEQPGFVDMRTGSLMAAAGRDWSCIRQLQPDSTVTRSTANAARLVQSLQVLSLAAGTVPVATNVRACAQRDVNCTAPLTANIPLDAQGWVDLPLFDGFDGYLEITGPQIVSTLLFYQDPLSAESRRDTTPLGVVETALLPMLTAAIGTPQDPALGLVYLRAFDCNNDPALGVKYTIDKPSVPWYFVAGLPSSAVTETEGSGLGGFINVPLGITVVDAALSNGERDIALPKTLLVRPNWMTGLRLIPALRAPAEGQAG